MSLNSAMKQGGRSDGWIMPTEEDVEAAEILMNLSKFIQKSEFISGYSFTWGQKKKRSVLDSKPESSPLSQPEKSPKTPLCLLPSGGGCDGGDNGKLPSSEKNMLKRKATEDSMKIYNRMQQEREFVMKNLKAMETLHQELTYENLELRTKVQKINYPRNMEQYHIWNNPRKTVDPKNAKVEAVSCSSNSHGGGRFGMFNQIDPRVKIQGESYDFMASSQLLDQSRYLVMESELRVRDAAAARKRRMLRMKQNKKLTLKLSNSRGCR